MAEPLERLPDATSELADGIASPLPFTLSFIDKDGTIELERRGFPRLNEAILWARNNDGKGILAAARRAVIYDAGGHRIWSAALKTGELRERALLDNATRILARLKEGL